MDVHQMKQENELQMQPPPGFAPKVSNGLERTTKAANINTEDEKADNCNKNAEEVAADDDDLSESEPEPESRTIAVPDPEFYDFDRGRTEECLAADQVWAIRDDLDAMPRLYALIRKVYSPFEVKIIWLDFVSDDQNEIALETSGLPIACGKFEHGETATLDSIGTFSHRIGCEKDGRNTYKIYPRKGEIWALWNVKLQEYMYEFVEVLSDYTEDIGIMVAHLVKVKGFVCMFKPVTGNKGMDVIQIPADELLRFSHMVPSYRMTGKEQRNVPEGYFELDPASLPKVLEEVSDIVVVEQIPTSVPSSTISSSADPESELYVFDIDRSQDKFQTGQVWALYGESAGSFPKYYARISKVERYPKFKVHIQWLEACAAPMDVIHRLDKNMPISCGVFSSGATTEFDKTARFSHLAKGAVARTRNKYEVYPGEGELWAIYREFSSELSSSDLQTCQYGIGKVVKVNALNVTFKVLVLEKVSGYLTVFKVQRKAGHESLLEIPHCESLRFSHQIPAFPLTDEKDGTLRGCWKLDPRAIPVFVTCLESDSSTFCKETVFSDRGAAMETNSNGVGTNPDISDDQSSPGPSHLNHYEIGKSSQFSKSKKRKNSKDRNTMDGGIKSVGGNSSTAFADVYHRKRAQGASGSKAATVSDGLKRCDSSTSGSKDADAHAKEMTPDCVDVIPSSVNGQMQIPSPPAHLKMSNVPETEFFNFNDERSPEKFKTGQIWALYFKSDGLPKSYARIESVELFPEFKLTIKWLESSHTPKGVISWVDKAIPVSCGTFKVAFGEGVVLNNSISFCHQVSGVPSGDNSYTIYPKVLL